MEKISFILEQSLNTQLLDSTCSMLLNFLYSCDPVLNFTAMNTSIIEATCNAALTRISLDQAGKNYIQEGYSTSRQANGHGSSKTPNNYGSQMSEEEISTIDHLFHKYFLCLQTISTCEIGVAALNQSATHVIKLIDGYLERVLTNFNTWEIKSTQMSKLDIGDESVQNVICVMSVMNSIMPSGEETDELIEMQDKNNHFFIKLLTICCYYLNFIAEKRRTPREEAVSVDEFESELEKLNDAKVAIVEFLTTAVRMKTENNVALNQLIDDCMHVAK